MRKIVRIIFSLSLIFVLACSRNGFRASGISESEASKLAPGGDDDDSDFHPPPEDPLTPPPVIISPTPNFCSQLDLVGVTWPAELSLAGQAHLGLALNITGSFEGRSGWANLSNNFDGMGFSIGILQQNLGMGSLQPLLIDVADMENRGLSFDLQPAFSKALRTMTTQWRSERAIKSAQFSNDLFVADSVNISPLDNDAPVSEDLQESAVLENELGLKSVSSANKASVNWALRNVYIDSGRTFKNDWEYYLTRMAQSKAYIGLQLKYAMKIYSSAFQYFQAFNLSTLSHFLLMFDFVVQNGGFKQSVLDDYRAKLKLNPKMTDDEKALLILQLRLRDVIPRWQNDVSARKKAIIYSEGTVHGVKRKLVEEYCYTPKAPILTQP